MMRPTLIMPETFEDCLTYTKQLQKLHEESANYETTEHANETFATKESLSNYETTEHANETFATKESLSNYETTEHANETFATKESLNDYETTAHATETYATKSDLQKYKDQVDANYLGKDEASTTYVSQQNLSTELEHYEPKAHAKNTYATKTELYNDYPTRQYIENTYATKTELNTKQDFLVFDNTPKRGSTNPVTSEGIYYALQSPDSFSIIKQLGLCNVSFSDSINWDNSNMQSLKIYTKDNVGNVEINAYCDYDVNLQNYNHDKFSWLLLDFFGPQIQYASGSEIPTEYGYADFSLMIGNHFYIGDIASVAFTDSNNNLYAFSVPSGSEHSKSYFINLNKDTAQTLTKGHISFRLTLLI